MLKNNLITFGKNSQNLFCSINYPINKVVYDVNKLKDEIDITSYNKKTDKLFKISNNPIIKWYYSNYEDTKTAVTLIGDKCQTESSGNISEKTIREYGLCGVNYISSGALTHSVYNMDLSLKAF